MNRDLWVATFMLLACAGLVATSIMALQIDAQRSDPTSQAFFDADGDPTTGYGHGHELVGRDGEMYRAELGESPGGWGPWSGTVEFYVDGVWQPEADCSVMCQVTVVECGVPGDLDGDGDVDLADYAEFQRAFGE
jgi:hypothetical protein